jgi:hypothetical protein
MAFALFEKHELNIIYITKEAQLRLKCGRDSNPRKE